MHGKVHSVINIGTTGMVVDIECHVSRSLPGIVIVGSASKAVDESKERLRGAFASSGLQLPRKRIIINLAPADIPKDDSSFDLGIAGAILFSGGQLQRPPEAVAYIGELGLDGEVRAVRGIIGKLLAGRSRGITDFFIPPGNLDQARLVPHIRLFPTKNLAALAKHLSGTEALAAVDTAEGSVAASAKTAQPGISISEVIGQEQAKRALEIAAAGGHNVFFSGPPGTGKSMLARALPSIMPELSHEEILEVTHIHSLAGHEYEEVQVTPPFRSPHHSASHVAVIGGGHRLRPGEISLAHRGVLFFDELPEFNRLTLEALRQPLEDRSISVSRAKDSVEYPASFVLVATANPCPCGFYGTSKPCSCLPNQIHRYQTRLSGPILDRIDLFTSVYEVDHKNLIGRPAQPATDAVIKRRIATARAIQRRRFASATTLNSSMSNKQLNTFARLKPAAKELLDLAAERLGISARSYMRTVKVARTIADLDGASHISSEHISEALQYRHQPTTNL